MDDSINFDEISFNDEGFQRCSAGSASISEANSGSQLLRMEMFEEPEDYPRRKRVWKFIFDFLSTHYKRLLLIMFIIIVVQFIGFTIVYKLLRAQTVRPNNEEDRAT